MKIVVKVIDNDVGDDFFHLCIDTLLSNISSNNGIHTFSKKVTSGIIVWRIADNEIVMETNNIDEEEYNVEYIFNIKNKNTSYKKNVLGKILLPFEINKNFDKAKSIKETEITFGFHSALKKSEIMSCGADLVSEFIFTNFEYNEGVFVLINKEKMEY